MASLMKMLTTLVAVMAVAIFFVSSTTLTSAQNLPSCAQSLVPCAEYLGGTTTPPSSCCNPVKDAVTNELPCLCNLYNTPGLLSSLGINVTQVLQLTQRCGMKADLSACKTAAAAPTSLHAPPPPVPGNNGSRMTWTGFTSLVLLLAYFSFY